MDAVATDRKAIRKAFIIAYGVLVGSTCYVAILEGLRWAVLFRGEIPSGAVIVGSLLILAGIFCNESAGFWYRLRFKG